VPDVWLRGLAPILGQMISASWSNASEFVGAPSDVQDQSVVADDGRGGSVPFEHSHGLEPSFESAVIAFDSAVGLLLGVVERVWDQLLDNRL
jgi:hypothetical protein